MSYSPLVKYLCQKCWHEVEIRYGFNTCPNCKAEGYMTGSYDPKEVQYTFKHPTLTRRPTVEGDYNEEQHNRHIEELAAARLKIAQLETEIVKLRSVLEYNGFGPEGQKPCRE